MYFPTHRSSREGTDAKYITHFIPIQGSVRIQYIQRKAGGAAHINLEKYLAPQVM